MSFRLSLVPTMVNAPIYAMTIVSIAAVDVTRDRKLQSIKYLFDVPDVWAFAWHNASCCVPIDKYRHPVHCGHCG